MTNRFRRILRALLFAGLISAAFLYPLLKAGVLQGKNSRYYQSLFEYYPASSYGDQSIDALAAAAVSFLIMGMVTVLLTFGAMNIAFGERFKLVVVNESKRSEKKLSPFVEALLLLGASASYFGASWRLFSLGFSTQNEAKSWKWNPECSDRVSELCQKVSENLHDLSYIYGWGGILASMAGLYILSRFFFSIVRSRKLRKNTDTVESSQEGVESAADEEKKL